MQLSSVDFFFWVAGLACDLGVFAVLLFRKRTPEFPLFTSFIAMNIAKTFALYFVYRLGSKDTYFYTYWALAIVDVLLQLAVVYEIVSHVFRPTGTWAKDLRWSFLWLLLFSAVLALALTFLASPQKTFLYQTIAIRGNFFASVLVSEIFVGITALSVTMGLPWKTHVARIAQGLGTFALIGFGIEGLHSYFGLSRGMPGYATFSHFRIAAYLACDTYWMVTLAQEAPVSQAMPDHMQRQLVFLQRRVALELSHIKSWGR